MATVKYKPTTPSRRNMQAPSFEEVTKFSPEKSLITKKKKTAGRNSYGMAFRSMKRSTGIPYLA